MATFGNYEILQELHRGPLGAMLRARLPGEPGDFAIKVFDPAMMGLLEADGATQTFLDRVAMQKLLASRGARHWAPIHELNSTEEGAFYVTDFYPLTADQLIADNVPLDARALWAVVSGVVKGLLELRSRRRRAHGNLKPTNVLIAGEVADLETAPILLTDPATEGATPEAQAEDMFALGSLIHGLVLHRPFRASPRPTDDLAIHESDVDSAAASPTHGTWPLAASPQWQRLGRQGNAWRELCSSLLAPDPKQRPDSLEAVVEVLRDLMPRRQLPLPNVSLPSLPTLPAFRRPRLPRLPVRKLLVAALVPLTLAVIAGVGALVLARMNDSARAELSAVNAQWFGPFEQSLRDPARRKLFAADPDLKTIVDELQQADAKGISFNPGAGSRYSLAGYQRTREALAIAQRIRQDLSPGQWHRLAETVALQQRFEARRWDQPATFLAQLVRQTQPTPDAPTAVGIERFLRVQPRIAAAVPSLDAAWKRLDLHLQVLDGTRDPVLVAFAQALRGSGTSAITLTDEGAQGLSDLQAVQPTADKLVEVVRNGFPQQYGRERFARDVESRLNLVKPKAEDIDDWLRNVDQYALVQLDDASRPVSSLRLAMEKLVRDVGRQPLSAEERAPFEPLRAQLEGQIKTFRQTKFARKDALQQTGEVAARWNALQKELDAARTQWVKLEDPREWVASVDQPMAATSDQVKARWKGWTDWLQGRADVLAADQKAFAVTKKATESLKAALGGLDETFPPVPLGLSESFAAAAWDRRERELGELTKWAVPSQTSDAMPVPPEAEVIKAGADRFAAWCANLKALSGDFPLNDEFLTPDDRPDLKWAAKQKDFWNDPLVQRLVQKDVARIRALAAVATASRADLVKLASESTVAEVAVAAWKRLGNDSGDAKMSPPWPTQKGELEQESKLLARLHETSKAIHDPATRDALLADLKAQAPQRWRRFAGSASADELPEAARLRSVFGVGAAEVAQLDPAPRFNLALYTARVAAGDGTPGVIRSAVDELKAAGAELKTLPDISDLLGKLARISDPEPVAARLAAEKLDPQKLPDTVTLTIRNSPYALTFARVAPEGQRPFYLGTTEVSLGMFIDLVSASGSWAEANALLGNLNSPVPLHGPQAWARPGSASQAITRWDTWRFDGGQAFDFEPSLRQTRFNRHALAEKFGSNPLLTHPMQQVPAQAALYAAGLASCRLPTPREWQAAYEVERKHTSDADWNLCDQTWRVQQDYTAANRIPQWPDAGMTGVFWPRQVPRPAQPKARPTTDGTLFFKTVDAPDAPAGAAGVTAAGTFLHLVGNVAEFTCDHPDVFDAWTQKNTADGIAGFLRTASDRTFVIGGSALSAPELDVSRPYPVNSTAEPYADVGFRLAFTAPAAHVAERLKWVVEQQQYLPNSAVASVKTGQ